MGWSVKKRILVSCSVGWVLTIFGAVLIPITEYIIKKKVEATVVIKEGGEVYQYWLDPPVPIYLQIYMFNLTNKEEFLQGGKPSVHQHGPYTYSERRVKFNITWNPNGTVSYRQKRIFQFVPEMSQGLESDIFILPNPVYWALFNALVYQDPLVKEILVAAADLFDEHPLMERPLKEAIWGYRDPILNFTKYLDPEWFYTDIVGYFMNKNDTDDGVYTVFTGETDINQLGVIDKYNGSRYLSFWSTPWANMVNGSDGTLGPPYLPKTMELQTFVSDICRSIEGEFVMNTETSQGIPLWRYGAPYSYVANATITPDNLGFCTPQDHCLGTGVVNITQCQIVDFFHIPTSISFPHFYLADPEYIDAVVGVHPNSAEHNVSIDLEPYTGLVLQAAKRLQINVYMFPIANVSDTVDLTPVHLPVFWLNESVSIDDENAKKFYHILFTPMLIIHVVEGVIIGLGALCLMATVIYGVIVRYKSMTSTKNYVIDGDDGQTNDRAPIVRNAENGVRNNVPHGNYDEPAT